MTQCNDRSKAPAEREADGYHRREWECLQAVISLLDSGCRCFHCAFRRSLYQPDLSYPVHPVILSNKRLRLSAVNLLLLSSVACR
jgi:hypothetical protein